MIPQALLFDCDGVLVDTERDGHRIAFNLAFAAAALNTSWSVDRYAELLEVAGGKERMKHYFNQEGWPESEKNKDEFVKNLHQEKTDKFMELVLAGTMKLRPGVRSLIEEAFQAGVPVAVCSTSNVRAVQGIVDEVIGGELAQNIQVFAGDMVSKKKPDPAIYLLGARTIGVDPAQCVVIEDSHIGLHAAKAAGARCIITKSTYTHDEDFSAADIIVEDLQSGKISLKLCKELF